MQGSESPSVPRHVAIVMDGNGRWAKRRYLPRFFGHKAGMDAVLRLIDLCTEKRIEYLTVFAFSSENWKRPADEVSGLMGLVLVGVAKYLQRLASQGVRIRIIGDREGVPEKIRAAWHEAEAATQHNTRLNLSVAFNYGGRWDVVQACRHALADGLRPQDMTEEALGRYTSLAFAPELDLFIRTGGEVRISNFLLWQVAYAELVFTDCLWPDFGAEQLDAALASFASRDRRFGGIRSAAETVAG